MSNQVNSLRTDKHIIVDISSDKQEFLVYDKRDSFVAWYKHGEWTIDAPTTFEEYHRFTRVTDDAEVLKILSEAKKALGSGGPIEVTEEHERVRLEKEANKPPTISALKSTSGKEITLYDGRDGFKAHFNVGKWKEGSSLFLSLDEDEDLKDWDPIRDKQEVERLIAEARQALKKSAEEKP